MQLYAFLHKRLERLRMLVSAGVITPIPMDTEAWLQLSLEKSKVTCRYLTAQGSALLTPTLFKGQLYLDLYQCHFK